MLSPIDSGVGAQRTGLIVRTLLVLALVVVLKWLDMEGIRAHTSRTRSTPTIAEITAETVYGRTGY